MTPIIDTFGIDPTPRRADGEFMAHAKTTTPRRDGEHPQVLMSGDLAGFDQRDDAIAYARAWAAQWIHTYVQEGTPAKQ
ncbi:hypothetical protein [Caballeronia grimmiae]|uniref:Uncharacterized protein n=1 Tax=Caballeronia grimmiae TaxID=1071679 RepID=A0A069NYR6_9BURK|nr:hypothetical protein [Caballeronia grimmiae]KDR33515.1 hypothetical protein BG57_07090 [Caballeronia grimmiae]GGD79427.1 hypothetical protein GCM10010985_37480 [Caballeronia grimmiae]